MSGWRYEDVHVLVGSRSVAGLKASIHYSHSSGTFAAGRYYATVTGWDGKSLGTYAYRDTLEAAERWADELMAETLRKALSDVE